MQFSFGQLIAHAARTRPLSAGTIIGSGTVSNEGARDGVSCLAELRTIEKLEGATTFTPWLKPGDTVEIGMDNHVSENIFGTISQTMALTG